MKNNKLRYLLILSILLTVLLGGCSSGADQTGKPNEAGTADKAGTVDNSGTADKAGKAEEKIKLTWALAWPPSNVVNTKLAPWFAEEVKKRSNGQVEIEIFHGGELLNAPEVYEGVVKGMADMGTSRFAFTPGRFPVALGYELPGIYYNNVFVTNNIYNDLYKKYKPKELEDTHLLWIDSTGPGNLYSKTPIKSLNDLKGMELRADGLVLEGVKKLGGIPVSMPIGDVYVSLDRGVIDGTFGRFGDLKDFRFAEVTKYITTVRFVYPGAVFFNTMNANKWNSLPPDIQKIFTEVSQEAINKSAEIFADFENEGIKFGSEKGMKVIQLAPEEEAKWLELLKSGHDTWAASMDGKGLPGQEMLAEHLKLAEKYNAQFPNKWPKTFEGSFKSE